MSKYDRWYGSLCLGEREGGEEKRVTKVKLREKTDWSSVQDVCRPSTIIFFLFEKYIQNIFEWQKGLVMNFVDIKKF